MTKPIKIDIVIGGKSYKGELEAVAVAVDKIGDEAQQSGRQLDGMNKSARVSKVGLDQLGGAVTLLGGAISVLALQELGTQFLTIADNAATLKARVELASEGLGDANTNMQALIGLSANAGQDLGQVVTLFEKMTLAAEGLGASNDQLLQVTDTVSKLTAGVKQNNATAALQQLGQALGNDIILAEEFNSIQENTPLLLSTVANALGMNTTELKKLQRAGELTSDMFFNGLLLAQDEADRRFSKMPRTVEKASTALDTRLAVAIAKLNTELGVSENAVGFIDDLAELIKDITPYIADFGDELVAVGAGLATLAGATAAVGVLKALALVLGTLAGPVGLFAAAAAGAVYFMSVLEKMPGSVQETKSAIAELEAEIAALNAQASANTADDPEGYGFFNDIAQAKINELKELKSHLQKLQDEIDGGSNLPTASATGPTFSTPTGGRTAPAASTERGRPAKFQANPYDTTGLLEYAASRRDGWLLDEETAQRETDRLLALAEEHRKHTEAVAEKAETAAKDLQKAWDSFGDGLSQSLARSLLTGENMVDDFLANIAEKIIQAQIQDNIVGPLIGAMSGSAAGGQGGWLAGLVTSVFAGGYATGGQMPANRVALVGEHGPELIHTGARGGYVQPNAGAGNVQVLITNESSAEVAGTAATAHQTPDGLVVGIVLSDINDNGPISRSLQANLDVRPRT
jgi:tape measure domain-containing protein